MRKYRVLLPEGGVPPEYSSAMGAIRRAHLSVPLRDPFRYGPSRAENYEKALKAGQEIEWVDQLKTVRIIPT